MILKDKKTETIWFHPKIKFNARNSILLQISSNIIYELKSLGCKEVGFAEKWIDND